MNEIVMVYKFRGMFNDSLRNPAKAERSVSFTIQRSKTFRDLKHEQE